MASGWDVYYVFFLSACLALCLVGALGLFRRLIFGRRVSAPRSMPSVTDSSIPAQRVNTRFYLGANMGLCLMAFAVLLIPCVTVIKKSLGGFGELAVVMIISVACLAGLGLMYANRMGDLSWLKSYRDPRTTRDEDSGDGHGGV